MHLRPDHDQIGSDLSGLSSDRVRKRDRIALHGGDPRERPEADAVAAQTLMDSSDALMGDLEPDGPGGREQLDVDASFGEVLRRADRVPETIPRAVEDDRPLGKILDCALEEVPDRHHPRVAIDRERRGIRARSRGAHDEVGLIGQDRRGGGRGGEPNVDAQALHLPLEVEDHIEQLLAGGAGCRDADLPAKCVVALIEDDLVTSLGGQPSGLHSSRSSAGNHDAVAGARRLSSRTRRPLRRVRRPVRPAPVRLTAGAGVDRARDPAGVHAAVLHEPNAGTDLSRASAPHLGRPLGVGEQRPAHADEIRLARRQRPLGQVRKPEAPGGDNGYVGELLDRLDETERETFLEARILDVGPAHPDRDRQVVGRGGRLEEVDDLERVVQRGAIGGLFVCAQANADRKIRTTLLADRFDHLEQQAGSALERVASMRVGPPVRSRGEELGDQVSVGRMDLDPVVTGEPEVSRRSAEAVDDHPHLAGGHLVRHVGVARRGIGDGPQAG